MDDYLWTLTYKWATYSHPNKSKWWVSARYFGKFNKFRNNRWVFGDATSGAHLYYWYSRCFPLRGRAVAQRDARSRGLATLRYLLFGRGGYPAPVTAVSRAL